MQNSLGGQVNTLGSGDELNGGGGVDTLNAKITAGAFVDGSGASTMPIQPETKGIEIVNLQAVESDIKGNQGNTQVYVNAKDMVGVKELSSLHSDADLVIQNLTSQGSNQLSDMTIGMKYTGNADTNWGESDMTVYFDQDYLTPEATRTDPVVDFLAMNEDGYDASNGLLPLAGVFFRELQFTLNGTTFDLTQYLGENPAGTGSEISTYADFLAAVEDALVELKADNAGNAALQSVEASYGQVFFTDVNPVTLVQREGIAVRLTVDGLTNGAENNLSVVSTDLEVARAAGATVPNNNRYEIADDTPPTEGSKLAINVDLEKVGLAGEGGELIIGSMNKTHDNVWDAVRTVGEGTTSGIEEFNVTVYGDASKSSSLSGLHSTNNNLRVVTVTTDAAQAGTSFANLDIGNGNTSTTAVIAGDDVDNIPHSDLPTLGAAASLKDVQTFDASLFKGDLHLHAALTREIADKYLDLVDQAPAAPGVDNVPFEYTGGSGDDYLNIALDTDNSAFAGTVTREDFVMNLSIKGGLGNDEIVVGMADDEGLSNAMVSGGGTDEEDLANWYLNQNKLANVRIDGGEGDDTISKPGSGDVIIDAGIGNDTVYADNTGEIAQWTFNYNVDAGNNDIESGRNDSYNLFKTTVVVSYNGFETKVPVAIVDTKGVATDLDINQAIKAAINSDPVLSKLLVATDGPAYSLVVTSLIDGSQVDALSVSLVPPSAASLSAADVLNLNNWYSTVGDAASHAAAIAATTAIFNDLDLNDTYLQELDSDGDDSAHVSDNAIQGDLGNDVLVLGTGELSNDTVVYNNFENGTDSIVNFVDGSGQLEEYVYNHSYTQGSALNAGTTTTVAEAFTVQFSATTGAGTVVFDGITVTYLATALTAAAAAAKFATDYNAGANSYNAVATGDLIVFTDITAVGTNLANVTVADFVVGVPTASGALIGLVSTVNGSTTTVGATAAQDETFTVHFDTNPNATTYSFDGETIPVLAGELGTDIAAAVGAGNYANWNAVWNNNFDVTFTSKTAATNVADAAAFGGLTSEMITGFADNSDYIDFSSYNAEAVYVNGALIKGTAALAGEEYITLVESATNDGSYTATVFTEAGATDTTVGVIGVLDFGATQVFVDQNFILA